MSAKIQLESRWQSPVKPVAPCSLRCQCLGSRDDWAGSVWNSWCVLQHVTWRWVLCTTLCGTWCFWTFVLDCKRNLEISKSHLKSLQFCSKTVLVSSFRYKSEWVGYQYQPLSECQVTHDTANELAVLSILAHRANNIFNQSTLHN